eukprot:COSAG01_NODE_47586_length_389_cov_0.589655_1_plen_29_part_01
MMRPRSAVGVGLLSGFCAGGTTAECVGKF